MTDLRLNGVPQQSAAGRSGGLSAERLRTILQDCHLNFLIGAGTPSAYVAPLGNIENALTELADLDANAGTKAVVRASIQALLFEKVLLPNLKVVSRDAETEDVLMSYARFLRTLNRILLRRHSSILAKQANIFTTNVDMIFEVAFEQLGIEFSDGFTGKIRPRFDPGEFSTLRFRTSSRYEHRSEVPVFNLIKLHGSASWLQERRSDKTEILFDHGLDLVSHVATALGAARGDLIAIADPREVVASDLLAQVTGEAIPESVAAFTDAYNRLGIVNPDKQKFATTVLNETYYELIRRFANELEKENSALFVHGFSFRDEHLRDLVVRAARTNPTLQVIVFCYTGSSLAEYTRLIPDVDIKNGNISFVTPRPPSDGEEERTATLDVITEDYFSPILADKGPEPDQRIELDIRIPSEAGTGV